MPENIIRIDRHMPGARLDRLVTQKVTEILNAIPDASGRRDRQDRPCTSVPADGRRTARALRARAHHQSRAGRPWRWGGAEARGGRQVPARGHRRGHDLPPARVPRRAPQEDPHERHDRTAQPRDQEAHARGRRLPRREQRAHARLRVHQVRRRERMVQPVLPRHVPAR